VAAVEDDGCTRVRDLYVISAPVAGRLLRLQARARSMLRPRTKSSRLSSLPALLDPRTRREAEERLGAVGAVEAAVSETASRVERLKGVGEEAEGRQSVRSLRQSSIVAAQQFGRVELALLVPERERSAAEHAVDHTRAVLRLSTTPIASRS
jgi:HlyD family secretion protein